MKVSKYYFKIRIEEKLHIIPWWRHTFISDTKSAESLSFVTRGTAMGNGRARCNYLAAISDFPEKSNRFENDKKFHTVTVFFSFKRVAGWECGTCWTARYFPIDFDRRNFSSLSWFIWQVARPCLNSSQQVNTKVEKNMKVGHISFEWNDLFLWRLRHDRNGGAWCPKQQVMRGIKEWIEVDLKRMHSITAVQTQGRFGNGKISIHFFSDIKLMNCHVTSSWAISGWQWTDSRTNGRCFTPSSVRLRDCLRF